MLWGLDINFLGKYLPVCACILYAYIFRLSFRSFNHASSSTQSLLSTTKQEKNLVYNKTRKESRIFPQISFIFIVFVVHKKQTFLKVWKNSAFER